MLMRCQPGLFAEIPKDLKLEIEKLENMFTVPGEKLKSITAHFVTELDKGLSIEGGSIVSCVAGLCVCRADERGALT